MTKISLILDEGLISKSDREEIIDYIKKSEINSEVCECDTHAMGGISWFPTDLIIAASGLTAAGFFASLGEDIYKQLRGKIKKILSANKPYNEMIEFSYVSFEIENIKLYFEFNRYNHNVIDLAFDKILSDFDFIVEEVKRLSGFNLESLTGKFNSITFIFDEEENKWVVAHFNKYY